MRGRLFAAGLTVLWANCLSADVVLPPLISDHMVLQAPEASIWGQASPGEEVVVAFGQVSVKAAASPEGNWSVKLPGLQRGSTGQLIVEGKNRLVVDDVLVGEVWLAAGQSNMAFNIQAMPERQKISEAASFPDIRMFIVARQGSRVAKSEVRGQWVTCSPQTVGPWSAVGYFFATDLHGRLQTPVGIINASVGNTQAQTWTPRDVLEGHPALRRAYIEPWEKKMETYSSDLSAYQNALERWTEASQKAKDEGRPAPAKPPIPPGPDSHRAPAALYNAMIHGVAPYSIKGALWYQGESDVQDADLYGKLLPALINSWRHRWNSDFPFLIVQLANFQPKVTSPGRSLWAELRDVQQKVAEEIPRSGLSVTIDIGDAHDIHPKNKQDVGRRLCAVALAKVYARDVICSGPTFEKVIFHGDEARIFFKAGTADGLTTRDGQAVKGFALAGKDRKFYPADVLIEKESSGHSSLVLRAREVPEPVAVRYAWADDPGVNLVNFSGLPAVPFRSDEWPLAEAP